MSIPLVRNNTKDAINTSIIAIKKNLERINSLLGLADSSEPDLSGLATKQELEDTVTEINNTIDEVETSLQPVDTVTSGNMHSVTSNAVANITSTKANTSKSDANLCYTDSTGVEFFRLATQSLNCPPSNNTDPTYIEAFTFNNGTFIRVTQMAYDNYSGNASYIRSGNGTANNITWSSWVKILNQSNVTDTVANGNNDPISSNAVYNNFLNKYRQVKQITTPNGSAIIQASGNNSVYCCYLITITRDSEQDTAIGIIYWIYGSGFFIKWIIPPTTTRFNVTIVQDSLSKATIKFTNNYVMLLSILDLNGRGVLTLS
jgi:hypothetical protein